MRIKIVGVYCKRKRLASGQTRTYYYHRATGSRLPDDPTSPDFLAAVKRLDAGQGRSSKSDRSVHAAIRDYRTSLAYTELRLSTRREYDRHLNRIEKVLGQFAVDSIQREHFNMLAKAFPDKLPTARAAQRVLRVLFSHAVELGWLPYNPFFGLRQRRARAVTGQRPYTEAEVRRFRETNPYGTCARLAFEVGLGTGLRIADLVRVPAEELESDYLPLMTNKTGELVLAPVTAEMRRAWLSFTAELSKAETTSRRHAVCNDDGTSMHKRTLSKLMAAAYEAAGFEEKQRSHALRYTAAVRLLESGFSFEDIAEHTGHRMAAMAKKYCEKRRNSIERGHVLSGIDRNTYRTANAPRADGDDLPVGPDVLL